MSAADPISALLLRMSSQWSQLVALAAGAVRPEPERAASDVSHLTRDSFNTHKMMVVVTAAGKVGLAGRGDWGNEDTGRGRARSRGHGTRTGEE